MLNPAAIEADFERLGTALALLSEKLALAEERRARAFRKGMLAIFIPLFLLILAAGGVSAWYFQRLSSSNAKLHAETRTLSGALTRAQEDSRRRAELAEKKFSSLMEQNKEEQLKLKKENAAALRRAEENHAKMMEKLTRATLEGIEKNRKEFPVILEKELSRRLSEKELFWHKEREKWARERLLFLKKISEGKSVEKPVKKAAEKPMKKPVGKPVKNAPIPASGKPLSPLRKPVAEAGKKPAGKVEKKSPAPLPEKVSGKEDEKKK